MINHELASKNGIRVLTKEEQRKERIISINKGDLLCLEKFGGVIPLPPLPKLGLVRRILCWLGFNADNRPRLPIIGIATENCKKSSIITLRENPEGNIEISDSIRHIIY